MTGFFLVFKNFFYQITLPPTKLRGARTTGISTFSFLLFFFLINAVFAQQPLVSSKVDTTAIKIGEQLNYQITVEADSTNLVVFPEGQSFNPMEVVESLSTDTARVGDRFRLIKEYTLTQFDSGSYTIPPLRVLVNDTPYLTDSVEVEVATVVVDTTKQKMYSIKPAMEVPSTFEVPEWVWWLLAVLVLAGVLFYFLRRRKKKKEAEKKLPPFERAMFELQQLDQSHLLENRQTKEYYSKLTEAVRRYIEDEVHLRAMESTTSELILYLEMKMKEGELKLSRETIDNLKKILQRADLAKFANSNPDIITAKGDRSTIENVIKDTKAAIPQPTEEELLKDEEYRQELLRKRRKKRILIGTAAGVLVLLLAIAILVSTKGFDYLVDNVFGNPTKELLQGEWISSEYGDPPVVVTTPEVLKRGELDLPNEAKEMLVGSETFMEGSLDEDLYVVVSTVRFRKGVEFDLKTAVDGVYANLEQKGAKNIVIKEEEYSTIEGVKGIKVYGTLQYENSVTGDIENKSYTILNFAQGGGFQQVTVIHSEEDQYADEISGRIINSVEFQNSAS